MIGRLVGTRWRLRNVQLDRTPAIACQLAVDDLTVDELEARNPEVWAVIDCDTDPALMAEVLAAMGGELTVHGRLSFDYDAQGRMDNVSFLVERLR